MRRAGAGERRPGGGWPPPPACPAAAVSPATRLGPAVLPAHGCRPCLPFTPLACSFEEFVRMAQDKIFLAGKLEEYRDAFRHAGQALNAMRQQRRGRRRCFCVSRPHSAQRAGVSRACAAPAGMVSSAPARLRRRRSAACPGQLRLARICLTATLRGVAPRAPGPMCMAAGSVAAAPTTPSQQCQLQSALPTGLACCSTPQGCGCRRQRHHQRHRAVPAVREDWPPHHVSRRTPRTLVGERYLWRRALLWGRAVPWEAGSGAAYRTRMRASQARLLWVHAPCSPNLAYQTCCFPRARLRARKGPASCAAPGWAPALPAAPTL